MLDGGQQVLIVFRELMPKKRGFRLDTVVVSIASSTDLSRGRASIVVPSGPRWTKGGGLDKGVYDEYGLARAGRNERLPRRSE